MAQVTFDELAALSDEMAALVRAGIPLDQGLAVLADDLRGRVGRLAGAWAERVRAGEDLATILASAPEVPLSWRSVVVAGMRSGRLAAALQGLAITVRQAEDVRRATVVSLIYPLIVAALAFGFLVFSCLTVAPILVRTYYDLVARPDPVITALDQISRAWPTWAAWAVVGCGLVLLTFWYRSGRVFRSPGDAEAGAVDRAWAGQNRSWRWLSTRQAMRDGRLAMFAELLKLMHDQQVPMSEALVLAADATGDSGLGQSARQLAERLEGGAVLTRRSDLPAGFPPLVGWSLLAGAGPTGMGRALTAAASLYRRRARHAADWALQRLPILWTVTIGGSAVLLYALVMIWPLTRLLFQLSLP